MKLYCKFSIIAAILSVLAFFCNIGTAFAQQTGYAYDAAGNRIKRETVISNNNIRKTPPKTVVSEMLSDRTIKIYPNPTKGMLKIEVSPWLETDMGTATLYNSNGAGLMSVPLTETSTILDITGYTTGMYLMHIKLGDNETTWKIIKE